MPIPQTEVVQSYLTNEVSQNRMVQCDMADSQEIHVSPLGIIPKKNRPGKWRLIVDLSSPKGGSVNDGINSDLCSLQYATVDMLAILVLQVGRGAFLVKADIKEAYHNIPVHPDDRPLLGIRWEGSTFVDNVLPFGLRSAPTIFSAVADAAQWMLVQRGIQRILHYLDDFVFVEADWASAQRAKGELCALFRTLGLPLEPSKLEGPDTCLTFLGIEVDRVRLQLRLPSDKLERLEEELRAARGRRTMFKRELQSLTGLLQHACKVVRPGRAFLQRLYALQSIGTAPHHNIRLNTTARADLVWWQMFVSKWNGMSMLFNPRVGEPDMEVVTDASGSWGMGGVCFPHWFLFEWPPELQRASIQVKELIPVVVAAALYGKDWRGKLVLFSVDNKAVVDIINSTHSKESHLMHLIRLLVFFACHYDFWFRAKHIPGQQNTLADALSRNNLVQFFLQDPPVLPQPSNVPLSLLALIAMDVAWTSTPWMELFRLSLQLE